MRALVAGTLVLGMVCAAAGVAGAQTPRARARAILRGGAYGFCHDADRGVRPGDVSYCGYVDAASACPEFARACAAMARSRPSRTPSCGAQPTVGRADQPAADVVPYARTARVAVLVLLGAAAAGLLGSVARSLVRARRTDRRTGSGAPTAARASEAPEPAAVPDELFARALEARARGDHATALYALYAALLRRLDERGAIRLDPAATPGDYVRGCRAVEARAVLRAATREVERVRFGGGRASAERFDQLRAGVEPVVRAATVLALVAALVTAGAPVGCGGIGAADGPADTDPGGHGGVRALLTAEGVHAWRLTEAPEDVRDVSRVLVLDAGAVALERSQWDALAAWVARGGALVLAGGGATWPRAFGLEVEPRGVVDGAVVLSSAMGSLVARVPPGTPALAPGFEGVAAATFVGDGRAYGAWVDRGRGRVLALAGAELVTNAGLAVGDNAAAVVALVRRFAGGRDVYFVEDPAGLTNNPVSGLARAGLLPAVVQGLLAVLLFYVMTGQHFGTPRDRAAASRRAFADHVRAVGGLYARGRASQVALRAYGALFFERLRERGYGRGAGRGTHGVDVDAIARHVGASREEVARVCRAVEQARAPDAPRARAADDLALVKALNAWYRALG